MVDCFLRQGGRIPPCRWTPTGEIYTSQHDLIADLTCGMGNFFNYAPVQANTYGCELDVNAYKVAKYLYPQANLELGDIRTYQPDVRFDYVVGNPPFNLRWWVGEGEEVLSQLYYCYAEPGCPFYMGGVLCHLHPKQLGCGVA